jgi:poly(3-hydroxybutyrate) depolymerase
MYYTTRIYLYKTVKLMNKKLCIATAFAFALCAPVTTHAAKNEINYGSLKSQYGDTLLLEYKGPAGTNYFTCTTGGTCKSKGSTLPTISPKVLGSDTYEKSSDGSLGVKQMPVGSSMYYFLYNTSESKAKKIAVIPYTQTAEKIYIAKNNSAVVFQIGKTYTRYDIASKKLSSLTLTQGLSFVLISPNATYVTGYNYNTLTHELWAFSDGKKITGPSSMQSYLEFSEDESEFAFLEDVKGFRTLFTMKASDLGKGSPSTLKQLTKPNTETEDYLYVGSTLYYMANVDGPLEWDLFSYNGKTSSSVDTDVSYGDFMKLVRTQDASYLAYLKTVGKNTNIVLHSPKTGKAVTLKAVKDSPVSTNIVREVKKYGDTTGVLLSPKKTSTKGGNLFIWMHGGPMRQVAKGFHPYLSYAVYDELLERLVDGGNYVYKIDYAGSTGYGAAFKKALDMKIGDIEMKEVENAIKDIKADKKIANVYLIGNSYGGYMALRGIVDTPKTLDGVVSINGVSDWYGLIQQIPSSPFKELFNGEPDTHNLDAYLQASVFTGMEKLTKDDKVLVVWGEQDSTVPTWQSTKYVEYAKGKKVNVETLMFPTEEHILRARKTLDSLCSKVTSFLDVKNVSCKL